MTGSLKKLILFFLAAYSGLLLLLFLNLSIVRGDTGLVSFSAVALTVLSAALCGFLVAYSNRQELGLLGIFLLLVGIYYWLPILNLLIFPAGFFRGNPLPYTVYPHDIELAVAFLSVAVPLSLVALKNWRAGRQGLVCCTGSGIRLNIYFGATAVMLMSLLSDLYRYLILGQGRFGDEGGGSGLNWIFYLFSDSMFACVLFVCAGVMVWPSLGRRQRQIFFVILGLYVVSRILSGSKSGLFDVFVFAIGAALMLSDFSRVKTKLVVALLAGVVVLFPMSFMAGFVARAVTFSSELRGQSIGVGDIVEQGQLSFGDQEELFSLGNVFIRMGSRVNALDPFVLVSRAGTDVKLDYWDSVPKSLANLIMPGDPFGEILASSRLFLVEYAGQGLDVAFRIYHTDVWYLYGVFVPFVGLAGSLLLVLICLRGFAFAYYSATKTHGTRKLYFVVFVFWSFYWFFVNLGLDEWGYIVVKAFVNMLFYGLAIAVTASLMRKRFDHLPRVAG